MINLVLHVRREFVRLVDKIFEVSKFTNFTKQQWLKVRPIILNSPIRVLNNREINTTPSGSIFVLFDKNELSQFYICVLQRSKGYVNGLVRKGDEMASSYGLDMVPLRSGDIIIDVGANVGDLGIYLKNISKTRDISYIAIEPGKLEYECLKKNTEGLNARLHKLALSDSCGFQTFYYSPSGADSSLFQPPHTESQYEVEVKSLDCLLSKSEHSEKRIRFLKLEAEGGELEILKGAEKSLPYIDFIGADLGFEKGINQESTAPAVIKFLLEHGFSIVEFTYPAIIRILFRNNIVKDQLNHHNGSLR
jgi:FkbM family methyltransferase